MPKVRLYNQDVRFHISQTNPFMVNSSVVRGHTAWNYLTPKVWFEVQRFPLDFDTIANNFAAAGLTGTQGETNAASWAFVAGATAHNIGRAVAYITDMYRAFYASRGISHDGTFAWWPGNAGQAGYSSTQFNAYARQWALFPHLQSNSLDNVFANGSTSDYLQISNWSGSTASQLSVQANTPYISAGLSAFGEWVRLVSSGITAGLVNRSGATAPAIVAGDWEQTPASIIDRLWFSNGIASDDMGSWYQMLNDPRVNTYKFFDRHTLVELWGATGGSAQYGRSPHQWSIPIKITAANDPNTAINEPSRPVDVIWSERINFVNYTPNFTNFYSSLMQRHREHLWSRAFDAYRAAFPNAIVGNYQNIPSTKRIPNRDPGGKIHAFNYTCDLGCTGPSGATFGYNDASVTGTFSLDYAAPVIYPAVPDPNQVGVQNWIPGIGVGSARTHYSGAWGTSALVSLQGPGIFASGTVPASYTNFVQHCSKQGMTGLSGGGTAEGYTGGNITDLRNYWFANAKQLLDTSRGALDSFNDNSNKPVIPWIGNANGPTLYHSIFSLTASSGAPYFADANGITNYTLGPWADPAAIDHNVAIVKYAIQTHNITDFFVFEPGALYGEASALQALDFWTDVVQTLLLDSASITRPTANIDAVSGRVARNTGLGARFEFTGTGSSDPEGDPLTYQWRTNTGLSASGPTAAFVLPTGKHTVTLTVSDPLGVTGATSTQVLVHTNNSTKLRLYNQDVRLHGLPISPFQARTQSWSTQHLNHRVWNYITPGVSFRADAPNEFTLIATNFASAGLTGSNGESAPGAWSFVAGQTAENYGRAVVYVSDMFRTFYTSRGMTYDGTYAWWPSSAAEARGVDTNFHDKYALWSTVKDYNSGTNTATIIHSGSTSDYLTISSWTGATSTQVYVQACTPYNQAGLSAFTQWTTMVTRGITSALSSKSGLSGPAILAGDFEQYTSFDGGSRSFTFFQNGLGLNSDEIGAWQQALNDPRANTYKFFGKHTLVELWGATGGSTQYGRSPHQWTVPFNVTAANNNTHVLSVTSCPVDIIWDQRTSLLNTAPAFNNFFTSFVSRHREYLWSEGWKPFKNAFANAPVGNYQNYPSTKKYPATNTGKIHGYAYTCDLGATGSIFSSTGYTASDVTGTFALDYAGIELYPFDLGIRNSGGWANMLPGYGGNGIRYKYSGAWNSGLITITGPGVFNQGNNNASYANFVQYCSKSGMTAISGGGTSQGYTGGNIIDYRNFVIEYSKQALRNTRLALDSFQDNSGKKIIPWIGDVDATRTIGSIFSLTASTQNQPSFVDVNGLTSVIYEKYGPFFVDYHVQLIKHSIQQHSITDFFVFDAAGNVGTTADALVADEFWSDVAESLLLDSYIGNSSPNAQITVFPSNDERDNTGTGVTFLLSATGSSDPDGDALTYAWNLSNGATAAGVTAAFTLTANNYTVNLLVTDAQGATSTNSTNILVRSNSAPTATITSVPNSTLVYDTNGDGVEAFVFSGINSSDPNGGSVAGYRWYVNGVTGSTASSINVNLPLGTNTIVLVVTDNGGLTDDDTRIVTVSNPPERQNVTSKFSAMIVYRGRIYTREEFDNMLRTLYRDKFNTISKNIAPTRKQF